VSVFVIAEAGVNHNGSVNIAYRLIDVAVESGADAVKFQTFKAESLMSKHANKADYQKQTTDESESQFEMIKKLELDVDTHKKLIKYCNEKDIMFLSTPFDHDSIDLLNELGLKIFKIPSGEVTNLPYLRHIGSLRKKVILSTGMLTLEEVGDALAILVKAGMEKKNITVLHANTMLTIQKEFDVAVGYSDHTLGIEVDIAAVSMGASIVEKHFTLDKTMKGPDHQASLEPHELNAMIVAIRNVEKALGDGVKVPSRSEQPNMMVVRKSIVAAQPIKKGEKITEDHIAAKRPGNGMSPMKWDEVVGSKSIKDYQIDELI